MASLLARNALTKAGVGSIKNVLGNRQQCITPIQVATLKATYGEPFGYAEPYPYKKKRVGFITEFFDNTKDRLNENSKIILVDGNIAVGKNAFSKRLARMFDLRHYPSVQPERVYVDCWKNYDMRRINPYLPDYLKMYDLGDFYSEKDPKCGRVAKLQTQWFRKKFENYCSASVHLLSTGQGVVVTSSIHSDIVYYEALRRMRYITPNYYKYIKAYHDDANFHSLQPHICIYLSAPIEVIRERIIKRNDPKEINSKMLSDDYLRALDDNYRNLYLKKMKRVCEVVEIDWTEVADDLDMDVIAEELESLKLENIDKADPKFLTWRNFDEDELTSFRKWCSRKELMEMEYLERAYPHEVPELIPKSEDFNHWEAFFYNHPAFSRAPGHVPDGKKCFELEIDDSSV